MKYKMLVACVAAVAGAVAETFDWTSEGNMRSVTLEEDTTFTSLEGISSTGGSTSEPNVFTINLNSYNFTWSSQMWVTSGSVASDRTQYPNPTLRFVGPGKVSGNYALGGNGNGSGTGLWLENGAEWSGTLTVYGCSRVVVKGGSKLQWDGFGLSSEAGSDNGCFVVEGEGSWFGHKNGWAEHYMTHDNSGLYVRDGATVDAYRLFLGEQSHVYVGKAGKNSTVEVDDATLNVKSYFALGGLHDAAANPANDKTDVEAPTLRMKGARAKVTVAGDGMKIFDKIGARIEFELPRAGFSFVPLAVNKFAEVVAERPAGRVSHGETVVSVKALDWMLTHPGENIALMEVTALDDTSASVLEWLQACAVVSDYMAECFEGEPEFVVAENQLVLVAPAQVKQEALYPGFTLSGEQTLKINVTSMGAGSDSITMTMKVNDGEEQTLAPDTTSVTLQDLAERTVYNVKVKVTNNKGYVTEKELSFATAGGDAQTCVFSNAEGGAWEDAANWEPQVAPATGDTVKFGVNSCIISAHSDKAVNNFIMDNVSSGAHFVLDMGGNTFSFTSSNVRFNAYTTTMLELRNGKFMGVNNSRLALGNTGYSTGSHIIIGAGAEVVESFVGDKNGDFLIEVIDGGKWYFNDNIWRSPTAKAGRGIEVRGAGSLLEERGYGTLILNGDNSGLKVLDGATAKLLALSIGNYNHPYFGGAAEDAFVIISNATLTVSGAITLGGTHELHPDTQGNDHSEVKHPYVSISGAASTMSGSKALTIYDGLAAEIAFKFDADGFDVTPLNVGSIEWIERAEGRENFGATRITLDCNEWTRANYSKSIELLRLTTPNAAGLARLVANSPVHAGMLEVNATGDAILFTACTAGSMIMIR